MIFAEPEYEGDYSVFHEVLAMLVSASFSNLGSGLQGNSWV
jgi:hypothetical protein